MPLETNKERKARIEEENVAKAKEGAGTSSPTLSSPTLSSDTRKETGRIGAEDAGIKKLKVRLPDGVNMRDPKTGKLIKDSEENKDLKSVELDVDNDVFWNRRINAGDVEWLNAPKGYKYQKTHRLTK